MSRREFNPVPVIEWAPTHVRVFRPDTGKIVSGTSIAGIRSTLGDAGEVVVAVSRRSSFLRTVRLPDAPKKEVAKILGLQLGQLFPLAAGEAAVDFYLTDDRNSEGRLAVVAAVKSETLGLLERELSENGLTARAVVPAAYGSSLLAKQVGRRECAIVESVPEGLAIDIVSEGELRASRVVPMPDLSQVDDEVSRTFAIAKVTCTDAISAGGFVYPEASSNQAASGLSLLAAEALPLTLEPPEVLAKRESDRVGRARRVALALWMAAIAYGYVVYEDRAYSLGNLAQGEAKWNRTLATLRKSKDQASTVLSGLEAIDRSLGRAFAPKQRLGDVAFLLNNLAPEGLWLTGVTLERGKLAQLRGTATTGEAVTLYVERLSTQPRFRDVKLMFANNGEIEKVGVVQFSIQAHVVGNFPLDTEEKK